MFGHKRRANKDWQGGVYIGQGDLTALFGEGLFVQLDADGAQARHDPGLISYLCLPASA